MGYTSSTQKRLELIVEHSATFFPVVGDELQPKAPCHVFCPKWVLSWWVSTPNTPQYMWKEKRKGGKVCLCETKIKQGRDKIFQCSIDLKSALCHVDKLCFRQRCFVWVITFALTAKLQNTLIHLDTKIFCFSSFGLYMFSHSCLLMHLRYLM